MIEEKQQPNEYNDDLKRYELVYLISNKFSEDELEPITSSVLKLITGNGGTIIAEENWGKRRLSYPIKHFYHAYYFIIEFDLKPDSLKKLEKHLRLSEEILRYLVVIKRIKTKAEAKNEQKVAEKRAEEIAEKKASRATAEQKKPFASISVPAPIKKKETKEVDMKQLDEKLDKILDNTEDLI
ncbi:MAG: 30S ribosomal protein S6 [Candidatus Falkowbacteria bacterium]